MTNNKIIFAKYFYFFLDKKYFLRNNKLNIKKKGLLMTTKQIAEIFNEGIFKGFRETEKHEFYLKQFNDKYYIIVFIKNKNGDKLCGCFTEDNFLGNVELLKKAFYEMVD